MCLASCDGHGAYCSKYATVRQWGEAYLLQKNMSTFATRLKKLRGAESQASFAATIEMNRVQYAKYESGANSPSVEVLERICRIHACSADWLLGLKDNGGVNVKADNGAAVAVGTNARATTTTVMPSGESSACKKCPHLKKLKKFEALLKK